MAKKTESSEDGRAGGIINLKFEDKNRLYEAYMPYLKNGGIFIPTNRVYRLGDEVFLVLHFFEEKEKIPVSGRIVWITPKGAQLNRVQGIGVQFRDNGVARTKIETFLAGMLKSDKPTFTL